MTRKRVESGTESDKVSVYLAADLKMRLHIRAIREKRTMSDVIGDAVRAYLKTPMPEPETRSAE